MLGESPLEVSMKRKSPRGIPDFSPKRAGFKQPVKPDLNAAIPAAPPPIPPKMKPQQTASKSGNRGK
jgi:hypothetical protein